MPSLDYMGYAVVLNAIPAPGNCGYSVFAIHCHVPNSLALQTPAGCEQGLGASVLRNTADLACEDAAERARLDKRSRVR
jgi:hypothetical protein